VRAQRNDRFDQRTGPARVVRERPPRNERSILRTSIGSDERRLSEEYPVAEVVDRDGHPGRYAVSRSVLISGRAILIEHAFGDLDIEPRRR